MHTTMLHLQISHTAHTGVTAQAAAAAHSTGSIQGSLHATGHRAPGEKRGRTYDCRPLSLFQVNLECESDSREALTSLAACPQCQPGWLGSGP
eukprot:scaffold164836_cov22-Tisochrysis_lutea.AAC.1